MIEHEVMGPGLIGNDVIKHQKKKVKAFVTLKL